MLMGQQKRVVIMGAAGRDFHNFNTVYRRDAGVRVVAFTATQIPDIQGRVYPAALAGELYPDGIPILAQEELERLLQEESIDQVVLAYSDVSHLHVMHMASRVLAGGADFVLLGPGSTYLHSKLPVVAVCAVRTGVGKSQTSRRVAELLTSSGARVAVIRHPMPYGDLAAQAAQRFASLRDLDAHHCTVEEREEYEHHLEQGHVVFAGVDYQAILEWAEQEADVILWDGGNNDLPFVRPDLHIVLADPHRPGHEMLYHPGEANLRAAHVVILNKVDTADPAAVAQVRENIRAANPGAALIEAASPVTAENPELLRGKKVLVVEDGPTLTHGEMAYGAGLVAARQCGAAEILDPRPYAVGSIAQVYADWPHLGPVLPAMGYSKVQLDELRRTIEGSPCEVVAIGTPMDLGRLLELDRPSVRVRYRLEERSGPKLADLLASLLKGSLVR
ncbi:MAG: GTPase [Armatimonadetes bacterium]|nr:GTPase [Armatimonadota bacterium]